MRGRGTASAGRPDRDEGPDPRDVEWANQRRSKPPGRPSPLRRIALVVFTVVLIILLLEGIIFTALQDPEDAPGAGGSSTLPLQRFN